jgi:hypothetical protein
MSTNTHAERERERERAGIAQRVKLMVTGWMTRFQFPARADHC